MKRSTITLVAFLLIALCSGCQSTERVLSGVDYACVDIEVDTPYTESGLLGRGIVLPDGETLTQETVAALCEY